MHIQPATHTPTNTPTATLIPVPNDHRMNAIPLKHPTSLALDVTRATIEQDDPVFQCPLAGPQSHTVWYRYAAETAQLLTLNTAGSSYDTLLAIWRETDTGLTQIACNNDYTPDTRQSRLDHILIEPGNRYLIGIAAHNENEAGFLNLYASAVGLAPTSTPTGTPTELPTNTPTATTTPVPPPPDNDDRANALPIKQPTIITLDTSGATVEINEAQEVPFACRLSGPQSHTVWYTYETETPQLLSLNTAGSSYDTLLGVWRVRNGQLESVVCNNDYTPTQRQARLDNIAVEPNTRYVIGIASNDPNGGGELRLRLDSQLDPARDPNQPRKFYLPIVARGAEE